MHREIEIFRLVMQTGSTKQAAEKLRISQPAVSQAIRKLEERADVLLFHRVRGRLVPTREAKAFLVDVYKYFIGIDTLTHKLHSLKQLNEGSITVASFPALGNVFLPKVFKRFNMDKENIFLSLKVLSSKEVYEQVSAGLADFGLMADEMSYEKLEHSHLFKEEGVLVMHQNHPLAKEKEVTIEQLLDYPFLSLSPEDSSQKQLSEVLGERFNSLKVVAETPYSLTICVMAQQGLGMGLVSPIAAHHFLNSGIVVKPLEIKINFSGILVFRPGHSLSEACQRLLKCLRIELTEEINEVKKAAFL